MSAPFWLPPKHDAAVAQALSRQGTPILSWIDRTRERAVVRLKQAIQSALTESLGGEYVPEAARTDARRADPRLW